MTQTFGTNDRNDLYLGPDGNITVLRGLPAVEAACATATEAQLGEMALAVNSGIPNFQEIWSGTPDYGIWQSFIQNTLENVDGVVRVTSLTLSIQNNTASYQAQITTEFGSTTINGSSA